MVKTEALLENHSCGPGTMASMACVQTQVVSGVQVNNSGHPEPVLGTRTLKLLHVLGRRDGDAGDPGEAAEALF